jgi:putative transposase
VGAVVICTDAYEGINAAVKKVFHASWQRCRVRFNVAA